MQQYYARRAPEYEKVYAYPERAADLAWLATRLPRYFTNRRVLEVACGTGYWTRRLASYCTSVIATDATAQPLEVAVELAAALPESVRSRINFQQADAFALPAGTLCDAGFAGLWLSHVERARWVEFLTGFTQRLQPGAPVVLIDNTRAQTQRHPVVETDHNGDSWQIRSAPDGSEHRVLKNFPTELELVEAASAVGCEFEWFELEHLWWFSFTRT